MDSKKSNPPSKLNEPGWRRNFISAFRRSLSEKTKSAELKMNNVLHNEPPSPEDVTLTTGTVKKKRKPFEIFHWKFILWSVLFVFGLCGTTVMWFTSIYYDEIFKTLTLGNGTKLHYAWKNPPLEPLLCVHIFNYTNADEYFSTDNKKSKSVKLKVQDVGPYCFRESIERQHIKFRSNETEMSYREQRLHRYDTESSVGSLNDTVVVPNVLLLTVYKEVAEKSTFERFTMYTWLSVMGAKALTTTTVEQYLFGYKDEIFNTIGTVHGIFGSDGKKFPTDFGILKKRRGLSNDTFVIRTGVGQLNEMGQVIEVNNQTQFSSWMTPFCNQIQGSDGLFFPRSNVQTKQDVRLFHKDSCKFLPLNFDDVQTLNDGIQAYRYKLRRDVFNSSKSENLCYCNATKTCSVYGALDISPCPSVQGAPIVLSRPHLMDSNVNIDSNGAEIIEGLQPDITKHDFHIDIFPTIGLTVRTLMRMQMNIQVKNPHSDKTLNPMKDKTVLPMVWVEMNSGPDVPAKMFSLLYHLSFTMKWAELALKWIFLVFTLFVAVILFRMSFVKSSKKELILISKKSKPGSNVVSNVYVPN